MLFRRVLWRWQVLIGEACLGSPSPKSKFLFLRTHLAALGGEGGVTSHVARSYFITSLFFFPFLVINVLPRNRPGILNPLKFFYISILKNLRLARITAPIERRKKNSSTPLGYWCTSQKTCTTWRGKSPKAQLFTKLFHALLLYTISCK